MASNFKRRYSRGGRVGRRRFQQGGHTHIPEGGYGAPDHNHSIWHHVTLMHNDQWADAMEDGALGLLSGQVIDAHRNNWYDSESWGSGDMGTHRHGHGNSIPNPRSLGRRHTRLGYPRTVPPVATKDLCTTLSTSGNPIFFTLSLLKVLF